MTESTFKLGEGATNPPLLPTASSWRRLMTSGLALVIAAVLLLTVVFAILVVVLTDQYRLRREAELIAVARTSLATVDARLSAVTSFAAALATRSSVVTQDYATFYRSAGQLVAAQPLIRAVTVLDLASGRMVLDSQLPFSTPPVASDEALGQAGVVAMGGKPVVFGPRVSPVSDRLIIPIRVPVMRDGKPAEVLSVLVDAASLTTIFDGIGLDPQWRLGVIGPNTVIAATVGADRLVGRRASDAWEHAFRGRMFGITPLTDREGSPVYAAFARAPSWWAVAVVVPRDEIDGPVGHTYRTLAAGVAVAILAAGGLAWIIGNWLRRLRLAEQRTNLSLSAALDESHNALRRSEGELRTIFEGVGDAVIAADENGIIYAANAAATRLFGWTLAEMLGNDLTMLMEGADRSHHDSYIRRYLETLEPHINGVRSREVTGRHKDGTPLVLELVVCQAFTDGTTHRFIGVLRDVSRRKEELAELRRWASAFEHAAVGIAVVKPETYTVELANPAFGSLHGMTTQTIPGWTKNDSYPPEELLLAERMFEIADRRGHAVFEARRRRQDGSVFPAQITVSNVRDEAGHLVYRIVTVLDITERQKMQCQLQQAQKMEAIGTLTGGLAHDFNNLLCVIIGNLELLDMLIADDPEKSELLRAAQRAALRGADLTQGLLAFARRQPLAPRQTDVNDLLSDLVGVLTRTMGQQMEIQLEFAADLWPVLTDPAQLESAITNLAINARDAMPNGGRLTIATRNVTLDHDDATIGEGVAPGDYALIEVSDSGTGMTPEVREKIFDPFFTTKSQGTNSGLGLSMVFGFVRQSHGHIALSSELGVGTVFRLSLPRDPAARLPGTVADAKQAPVRGGTETILLVEDNAELRRVTKRHLGALGYAILEADSATEALVLLDQGHAIDLLFTDIVLPGSMNGLGLARAAVERFPALKVLLASGFSTSQFDAETVLEHEPRVLRKPYGRNDMASSVRHALDQAPARSPANPGNCSPGEQ